MEVGNLNNGEVSGVQKSNPDQRGAENGEQPGASSIPRFVDEIDSSCSTPYVSAPSSPGRGPATGFFFSAPASPMHYVLSSAAASSDFVPSSSDISVDFEFSARFNHNSSSAVGSMISADELFLNGQIRPMKLSSHLQRPQVLAPLLDLEVEDDEDEETTEGGQNLDKVEGGFVRGRDLRLRNRSLHRRTRSMSPLRNWRDEEGEHDSNAVSLNFEESGPKETEPPSDATTPSVSASSSRSSSTSGRGSKRWIFLMDFLHRSKSEGRGNNREKFWSSISFSPSLKEKKTVSTSRPSSPSRKPKRATNASQPATRKIATAWSSAKPANAVGKRRIPPSPHELHYTANRAQAEEMKKKTFLPYRQGLLGCLGFSSKSYGAMNGLARTLNPVSSSLLIVIANSLSHKSAITEVCVTKGSLRTWVIY
ncbi:hypothetical protein H6P81_004090 [Aristolochia fimbriata]|uniref:Uncharacterized protein n=1 Tax=Aristolochia fimbriata TaxID=158543 RepID=A0AAV7FH71_ARIFI|nr:hypothetical protein H6P81_004090 [Aristolochia fimbriata]